MSSGRLLRKPLNPQQERIGYVAPIGPGNLGPGRGRGLIMMSDRASIWLIPFPSMGIELDEHGGQAWHHADRSAAEWVRASIFQKGARQIFRVRTRRCSTQGDRRERSRVPTHANSGPPPSYATLPSLTSSLITSKCTSCGVHMTVSCFISWQTKMRYEFL